MITPEVRSTPETLLDALLDARRVELALLDDLSDAQMLGPRGHFLEPPIWEMGHVGWFQEYWLLRRLDGADPLLPGADEIYDSFSGSAAARGSRVSSGRRRRAGRHVHAGRRSRGAVRLRQREVGASRRGRAVPYRRDARHERGAPSLRRRRRLSAS